MKQHLKLYHKLTLQLFRILLGFRNKSTYLDQKQRAIRHLDMHSICIRHTYRVKSEIFILQTTCHYQYETRFSEVFFSAQLTRNILRNYSKKLALHEEVLTSLPCL